jgi:class 3 adenylate cyclase/tetratricopeptide (TPR) repeat protein
MPLCPACGEDNPDKAKFCLNCGSPLAAVCGACGQENPAGAKFCLNCGNPLAAGAAPPAPQPAAPPPPPAPAPAVPEEERKLDTLVFVDLVGSTALAEQLDPEDVLSLLEMYYGRLRTELEARGGTVEKYIGDAIVTHFGVPVAHEDDPERAVNAALAILDTVERLNAEDTIREIQVRIGIATGEVIVTHGQQAHEGKGIAWGDVLNTAARIESAAPVNGILVGELTYRATVHAIDYEEHEPIEAKGKSEPVPVWRVIGCKTEAPARGRAREAPLIGRAAELERLLGLWASVAADGAPALAAVVGDPGIGKSRLITELGHRAEDAEVLWGRCLSYGEGITYWPVVEMLEDAAGVQRSDEPEEVSRKLSALLDSLAAADDDERRTMAAALSNLLDAAGHEDGAAAAISQAELHWGVRRTLEHLAAQRPLLLVFEDLHWAEPTLFELIDYLLDGAGPILVLASARRELEGIRPELFAEGPRRTAIRLTALGEEESLALLTELLGEHGIEGKRAEALLRNAGGNPLFLEETVRMLADTGVLDGEGDLDELAVPSSLQAMIGARLDGLPAEDKRAAQHASVVGMTFWSGAVAELHGGGEVDPSLESLGERDMVKKSDETSLEDEREWEFKHGLIKDVAYARVPKARRATLHVRFVDWVKSRRGVGDEVIEIVAYHLEQACKHAGVGRSESPPPIERAVEALMQAAEKAERREGIREADRFYARALELLGDRQTEQALEARIGRAGTLQTLGDLKPGDELFARVAIAAQDVGRPDIRARALIERANIGAKQGRVTEARGYAAEAAEIAGAFGDRSLEARAIYRGAYIRWWFEEAGEAAVGDVLRALGIAEELKDQALQVEIRMWLASLLYNGGRLSEAEEHLDRCFALLGEVVSLRDEARATWLLALVKFHQGHIENAESSGLRALDWLERTGDSFYHLQDLRLLALCALARNDLALAESRLRAAIPLAKDMGGALVVDICRILVDVLIRDDHLTIAREFAGVAAASAPAEDAYAQAACLLIEASISTADGQHERASRCFSEALRLLEQQQLPLDVGEARVAYGRALRAWGDEEGALRTLGEAREQLDGIGAHGLVAQIDRELAELRGGPVDSAPLASS